MPALGEQSFPWYGMPRHLLKTFKQGGYPMYFESYSGRWIFIPKEQHPAFKRYVRQLAKQLPAHEKLITPDAGFGWRLLFLVTLPISAPLVFFYAYLRAFFAGEEI